MGKISGYTYDTSPLQTDYFIGNQASGPSTFKFKISDVINTNLLNCPIKFSAYKSASNQTIANGTPTQVVFDVEDYDTSSSFASNTFTAPIAGWYFFSSTIQITAAASLTAAYLRLYKNGSSAKENGTLASASINTAVSVMHMLRLAASDTIDVRGLGSGAAFTSVSGSTFTYFEGFLFSAT